MNHMITVIDDNGTTEYEVVTMFRNLVTKREILLYSDNQKDQNGKITVHFSSVDRSTDPPSLDDISDSEWEELQALIDQLLKEPDSNNGGYTASIHASTREAVAGTLWEMIGI